MRTKPLWYTHDYQASPAFVEELEKFNPALSCEWDSRSKQFAIIEKCKDGTFSLACLVPKGRQPGSDTLHHLRTNNLHRFRKPEDAYEELVNKHTLGGQAAVKRATANHVEAVVSDNSRRIAGVPQFALGSIKE